jgi:hypothetical protein
MKRYKISIPRRISYTECEVFYIDAESEGEAMEKFVEGNNTEYIGEFENQNDYDTVEIYDTEIEELKPLEVIA